MYEHESYQIQIAQTSRRIQSLNSLSNLIKTHEPPSPDKSTAIAFNYINLLKPTGHVMHQSV